MSPIGVPGRVPAGDRVNGAGAGFLFLSKNSYNGETILNLWNSPEMYHPTGLLS